MGGTSSELFWISVATVSKVLLIAVTGIILASQMTGGRDSVKGLGFYTVYVLLPCLLFTKLVDNLTWELLQTSFAAPLCAIMCICIGYCCGQIAKRYVPLAVRGHVVLACTGQNAVSFALALLYSLKGVAWLDADALSVATSYVFLYNVPSSLAIWALGTYIVRSSVEELRAKEVLLLDDGTEEKKKLLTEVSKMKEKAASQTWFQRNILPSIKSPPLVASFLAIVIALTPPLNFLSHHQPLHTLMSGLRLVGDGTVPLQLLVLGCNLIGGDGNKKNQADQNTASQKQKKQLSVIATSGTSGEPLELPPSQEELNKMKEREALRKELEVFPPKKLGLFVGFVRLVVIPAILFMVLHIGRVAGVIPNSKVFLLTMFIEVSAPSAINASILVNLYNYRGKEYTEMLLTVYTMSIATATFWISVALWYINTYVD